MLAGASHPKRHRKVAQEDIHLRDVNLLRLPQALEAQIPSQQLFVDLLPAAGIVMNVFVFLEYWMNLDRRDLLEAAMPVRPRSRLLLHDRSPTP